LLVGLLGCILSLFLYNCLNGKVSRQSSVIVPLLSGEKPALKIVTQGKLPVSVEMALNDLTFALEKMTDVSFNSEVLRVDQPISPRFFNRQVFLLIGSGMLADEPLSGYELERLKNNPEQFIIKVKEGSPLVIQVEAGSPLYMQYAIYSLLKEFGVAYYHPRETYFPKVREVSINNYYQQSDFIKSGLKKRGFHFHTEFPIPLTHFLFNPSDKNFGYIREYLDYLVRNLQNVFQFSLLSGLNMEHWTPYGQRIANYAHQRGIKMGASLSFNNQQKKSYQLISDTETEETGQIETNLKRLLKVPFDSLVLDFSRDSRQTWPAEKVKSWFSSAKEAIKPIANQPELYGLVLPDNDLLDENNGQYYHLLEGDEKGPGYYVTVPQFYNLTDPALIHGGSNLHHQRSFIERNASAKTKVVYFPANSWWQGFDIDFPLVLPLTAYSRWSDMDYLKRKTVAGQVTFTSGQEWGYWIIDYYTALVALNPDYHWKSHYQKVAGIISKEKAGKTAIATVLEEWTEKQRHYFFEKDPFLYYYLIGISPPKTAGSAKAQKRISFSQVVSELSDDEYYSWMTSHYDVLIKMQRSFEESYQKLPTDRVITASGDQKLWLELKNGLQLYLVRLKHLLALYQAAMAARKGNKSFARERLDEAKELRSRAQNMINVVETHVYRYPLSMMTGLEANRSYFQYGYLRPASKVQHWFKGEQECAQALEMKFGGQAETFKHYPYQVFRVDSADLKITEPESSGAKTLVKPFLSSLLLASHLRTTTRFDMEFSLALDHNQNFKPDLKSESFLATDLLQAGFYQGSIGQFPLPVRNQDGNQVGILYLNQVKVDLELKMINEKVSKLYQGKLSALLTKDNLLDMLLLSDDTITTRQRASRLLAEQLEVSVEDLPRVLPLVLEFLQVEMKKAEEK